MKATTIHTVIPVSGLYVWQRSTTRPDPIPPFLAPNFKFEELRLDVDGFYPQMVASGVAVAPPAIQVHWIANLTASQPNVWNGEIFYKNEFAAFFPYTNVQIQVTSGFPGKSATVTFFGGGGLNRVHTYNFKSPYFHSVDFEFDSAEGEEAVTTVNTCAHPRRPSNLPCEELSIQEVYRRAGFDVTTTPGSTVPLIGAGPDAKWSDQEMHDAMQSYWSHFASKGQWAMWVFFASLHEMGQSLGGIMFDDIGPNHRQGTAIFNDSFISQPPPNDPNPLAWVQREIFCTSCHEMGHAFNLAHSWQKSLGRPWIPLRDESEARSFMNYPNRVFGGQESFFSTFEYRLSDQELLFMRHAPAQFVQPGNADWFDHHAFQAANVSPEPMLKLELRANREKNIFEFLEPVTLELKLTNILAEPQLVDENLLSRIDSMTVILKKDGKTARQFIPYAQYCWQSKKRVLMPGESVYESLFVSAGLNGWDIAEPGYYTIQIDLHVNGEDIVSNKLRVRVEPPRGYNEEFIAQDLFSDDVGRIISFDGSRFFAKGNDTLREVAERLPERRVALHASLALGNAMKSDYKYLDENPYEPRKQFGIKIQPAHTEEAYKLLTVALTAHPVAAVESFGHIDFTWYVNRFSDWLAHQGAVEEAVKSQDVLYQIMSNRQMNGRRILDRVLQEINDRRASYRDDRTFITGRNQREMSQFHRGTGKDAVMTTPIPVDDTVKTTQITTH